MLKIKKMTYHHGYTSLMSHPYLLISVSTAELEGSKKLVQEFDTILNKLIPAYSTQFLDVANNAAIFNRIAYAIELFYESIGYPLLSKIIVKQQKNNAQYFIPVLESNINAASKLLQWIISIVNGNRKELGKNFSQLSKLCKMSMPQGVNPYKILRVSYENNIPWRTLDRDIFQLGWGSRSRLFNSTITDQTSRISMKFAQNKLFTKKLLQSVGLPVATSGVVKSQEEAVKVSQKIGYPVVVKPIDQDAGRGVSAGLISEKIMLKAYEKAAKFSKRIMIEKHFEGNDHRLHILHGECYYATQRRAPTIIGDGKNTIKCFIQELNTSRINKQLSGNSIITSTVTKGIEEDEELFEILEERKLQLDSVLKNGEVLKLRRIANVSTGGTSTIIEDLSIIHKDNIELAKRAVETLRLDIAAVDFLIPDITKSWMEVGAIIVEVNSMPQIGHNDKLLYALKKLVQNDGRIPTVVVVGDNDIKFNQNVIKKINQKQFNIGITTKQALYKNSEITSNLGVSNAYQGSLRLISDPSIDAIIVYIEDLSMFSRGLAIDKFDSLVLLNSHQQMQKEDQYIKELSDMAHQIIVEKNLQIDHALLNTSEKELLMLGKDEIEDYVVQLFAQVLKQVR